MRRSYTYSVPSLLHSDFHTVSGTPRQAEFGPKVALSTTFLALPAVANTNNLFESLRKPDKNVASFRKCELLEISSELYRRGRYGPVAQCRFLARH